MDQRVGLFVLLAAGILCFSLAPASRAEDALDEDLGDDMDVEDELDLGLAEDEDPEGDVQEEVTAKALPPAPKVGVGSWRRT